MLSMETDLQWNAYQCHDDIKAKVHKGLSQSHLDFTILYSNRIVFSLHVSARSVL